jgi:hypothetical protein
VRKCQDVNQVRSNYEVAKIDARIEEYAVLADKSRTVPLIGIDMLSSADAAESEAEDLSGLGPSNVLRWRGLQQVCGH